MRPAGSDCSAGAPLSESLRELCGSLSGCLALASVADFEFGFAGSSRGSGAPEGETAVPVVAWGPAGGSGFNAAAAAAVSGALSAGLSVTVNATFDACCG
jgi:hypothetical protein